MKKISKRIIVIVLAVVVLLGAAFFAFLKLSSKPSKKETSSSSTEITSTYSKKETNIESEKSIDNETHTDNEKSTKSNTKINPDSYNVGDTFTFGSYPQSKVTDSEIISKLNSKSGSTSEWTSYNYYCGTNILDDGQMTAKDYMKYKDIEYNGEKYRGVYFEKYRPYLTSFKNSKDDAYQDDNGYYTGNTYYFKFESLTWKMLDPSDGFVMCTKAIDSQAYNNYILMHNGEYYGDSSCNNYASDWANSSIRIWLNEDFYNTAFSEKEKSQIGTTNIEKTSDKIFLLSNDDVLNSKYGFSSDRSSSSTRKVDGSDYAKCQGLMLAFDGTAQWWRLRSSCSSHNLGLVFYDGTVAFDGNVCNTNGGILPALKFNP